MAKNTYLYLLGKQENINEQNYVKIMTNGIKDSDSYSDYKQHIRDKDEFVKILQINLRNRTNGQKGTS